LGGVVGYGIGFFGYETIGLRIVEFYHGQELMESLKQKYDTYGFWGVLSAALTPIPYKIFTISSGFFKFDFVQFLGASILGRSIRFFLIAALIFKFGAPIKTFIDKYFNILAIIFLLLLIGGFILIKYLL
jgi:membrane protein YqaA with SNARE-associated domain